MTRPRPVRRERGFVRLRRCAEQGFTPVRRFAEHGFTLVELMVVITIIGLAAAVAAFAMPDPRGRVLDEALRFAARARSARDLAVVEGRPVSLWLTSGGYGFDQRTNAAWVPVVDKPLRVASWADETRAAITDPTGRMRVTFDTTGGADRALEVRLSRGDAAALVWIGEDGQVRADAQ